MHNSAMINLNVVEFAHREKVKKIFYSSSACMYPERNQVDPNNPNCKKILHIRQSLIVNMGGKNSLANVSISRQIEIITLI